MATINAGLSPLAVDATTTTTTTNAMLGGNGAGSGGELLSSVAAVRELLLRPNLANPLGTNHHHRLSDELSAVQQSRYEDRLRFEQERKSYVQRIDELTSRLQQSKRELEQEQAIRKSLEETNEALEKHKDELSAQLEELSCLKSSPSTGILLEQESGGGTTTTTGSEEVMHGKVQSLEQEKLDLTNKLSNLQQELSRVKSTADSWKNQCLVSQRQVQAMQIQLESFQKEFQLNQDRQRDLLQTQDIQYESFRRRLEESIAARKKAEEELQTIMSSRKATTISTSPLTHPPLPQAPETVQVTTTHRDVDLTTQLTEKYHEAQEAKVKAEERVHQLELELETLKQGTLVVDKVVEKDYKAQEDAIEVTLSGLKESLATLQNQVDSLAKELQQVDDKNKESATDKKEELSVSITKLGTLLESMESQLKEKLALTKTRMEDYLSDMKRIRQELTEAKTTVTTVQSEIIECQQKQKKLAKVLEESSPVENKADTPTAEAVANAGTGTATADSNDPKKRTSADNKGTPNNRKRPKK